MANTDPFPNAEVETPRLLHAHQTRGEPADSHDDVGRLLSGQPRADENWGTGQHPDRHPAGGQRHSDAESVDGTGVGRPDAPDGFPSAAFGTTQRPAKLAVRRPTERGRRTLSAADGQRSGGIAGGLDAALLSAGLHATEAQHAALHPAGSFPGGDAHPDRLGGSFGAHQPAGHGFFSPSSSCGSSRISWRSR